MTVPGTLLKKWKKLFHYRDTDNDGMVTEEDYKRYAEHFVTVYGDRAKQVREISTLIWETFTPKGYQPGLTEEELLDNYSYLYTTDRQSFEEKIKKYGHLSFYAIDTNEDGMISLEEYSIYQNAFNIHNRDYIEHIFRQMDVNQDGVISREEFVGAIMDYVFEDAPPKIPELYDHERAKNFRKK